MKINKFLKACAVPALFFATAMSPALAENKGVRNAPFEARLITQEKITLGGGCPVLSVSITGTGIATHLGAFTAEASHCAAPAPDGSIVVPEGKLTLTGTNGEQLTGTYSIILTPTKTVPVFTITGTYKLTGGTGRFADASGVGVLQGLDTVLLEQVQSGPGHLEANGSISF